MGSNREKSNIEKINALTVNQKSYFEGTNKFFTSFCVNKWWLCTLGQWKYNFLTQKEVKMPFPLEMSGFHHVIFQ